MPILREENLQSVIVFSNVSENFFIHETMLSATFQKVCQLQEQKVSEASDLYRSEEPKRMRQKSLGSLPKTELPKEWAFIKSDLKSAKPTVFGSRVPKE